MNVLCESCADFDLRFHVNVIKHVFTTTAPSLRQKGKIPVQEVKTPETMKLKSKFTRIPKEPQPEPEVIHLKKVPVKTPPSEKQVETHKAEVTRHHNPELTVQRLHEREDREIITLGRTERVFTAEEESIQFGHLEEEQPHVDAPKPEKARWTRTLQPQKEEEPEVPRVEKKKITELPKADEHIESVKLKPFDKSGKPEEDTEKIKLKKAPAKPKECEKEVVAHKVDVTRHHDTELVTQKVQDREDVITPGRPEPVLTASQKASELGQQEEPESLDAQDGKSGWIRTPKAPKGTEPEPHLAKKKIKTLPKEDEGKETVTLKPFDKPQKPESVAAPETKKEVEAKMDSERTPFTRGEIKPTDAEKRKPDKDASITGPDTVTEISKDQKDVPLHRKEAATKPQRTDEVPSKTTEQIKDQQPAAPKKVDEKLHVPAKIPSPPGQKEVMLQKDAKKELPPKQMDASEKGVKFKKAQKEKVEEEKPLKPVEQLKKVELKKTPSPKPKDREQTPTAVQVKTTPKAVSPPKDRKPTKKVSPEERRHPDQAGEGWIPLGKQVSPAAVQMKRVTTQPEEEVFKEEAEEVEGEEEEEAWGWELVPDEDWEGEGVEGAMETPGMPGARRGEVTAGGASSSHLR